jgi:hypothetical protein
VDAAAREAPRDLAAVGFGGASAATPTTWAAAGGSLSVAQMKVQADLNHALRLTAIDLEILIDITVVSIPPAHLGPTSNRSTVRNKSGGRETYPESTDLDRERRGHHVSEVGTRSQENQTGAVG